MPRARRSQIRNLTGSHKALCLLLVELKAVEQLAPMLSGKLILGGVLAV